MKKLFTASICLIIGIPALTQTLEEGKKHLYYERYQSAEQHFGKLVQQQPGLAEAWYGLTLAHLYQEEPAKAAGILYNAPPSIRDDAWHAAAYGRLMLSQGKKDSAAGFFNHALDKTREKDPAILEAIARAHVETEAGDAALALELTAKALKRDKKNAALKTLEGDAHLKARDGSAAYAAYKEAIEWDGNYAPAYYKIGKIFSTQKNKELYLEYFNKALEADAAYAPALQRMYVHYFYYDPAKALEYYNQYAANSDASPQRDYELADLYFVNKSYDKAIEKASGIMGIQAEKAEPRLLKLIGYSYAGKGDTSRALSFMQQYFLTEADSNFLAKDYRAMAEFHEALSASPDSAMLYYTKAASIEKDSAALFEYYKKLAGLYGNRKDFAGQAKWLGSYYRNNEKATNVDLFNWGLAWYRAEDYAMADSVFGMYVTKYPEQSFGYYWQARSNAARDKEMDSGLAVPYYQALVQALQKDTTNANYRNWMVEAYGYMAVYEANKDKDYEEAIGYFQKVLSVDPDNEDAKKYIAVLEKSVKTESDKEAGNR
ncbi:MAG TPA: hypothetical protein VFR58_08880 [Flavisolibacter sp.]|nr:hypothetical protein [Flavisolibacter sp.]